MNKFKALEIKRQFVTNKYLVAIDPGKKAHQAVIINCNGMRCGNSFSFVNNQRGYVNFITKVKQQTQGINAQNIILPWRHPAICG